MTKQDIAADIHITGMASVSPMGPIRGLIGKLEGRPGTLANWPTRGIRNAFLVAPVRPNEIVPGLKTRRLDRLSVWSLIVAHLALQDARISLEKEDPTRFAVVFGTGFGCVELTESYLRTVAGSSWAKADPIIFPETLDNSPASHVARSLGLRGPNITLSCRGISGESALIQAASSLHSGQVDRVIVMAGDTLTRPLYEWYETAGVLSPACFGGQDNGEPDAAPRDGFIPGEGMAGIVMERGEAHKDRGAHVYARYGKGSLGGEPGSAPHAWGDGTRLSMELIRRVLGAADPSDVKLVIACANGSPQLDAQEALAIQGVFGSPHAVEVVAPKALVGEFDGNGILRFILALSGLGKREPAYPFPGVATKLNMQESSSQSRLDGLLLLLGASAGGGRAAISWRVP